MEFTVLMPVTGDRAALALLALRSLEWQEHRDHEVRIVADGVEPAGLKLLAQWAAAGAERYLHVYDKGPRRGEASRHAVLAEARGRHVAYLLDRDLWFPDHLRVLAAALSRVDFAHTGLLAVDPAGTCLRGIRIQLATPAQRAAVIAGRCPIGMSTVGHRMDAYRRLPYGWRETPPRIKTDQYMWAQFLAQTELSAESQELPTILWFSRNGPPVWSSAQRQAELSRWLAQLPDAGAALAFREALLRGPPGSLRSHLEWHWRSWRWWHPAIDRWILRIERRLPGGSR
jgi:hypothetical protein